MKKILFLIVLLLPGLDCLAQTIYKDQVRVENQSITRNKDNRLTVAMNIILQKNMKVTSNKGAILTPIITKNNREMKLPPVLVYGRRRDIYDKRNNRIPKNAFVVVRRKGNTEQTIKYLTQVPFQGWMQGSKLVMNCDLCGCRDAIKANTLDPIANINISREKPLINVAYLAPKAEAVKIRSVVGKAFLDYPVNKTTIYPNFRRNASELSKVRATIDTVRNDKNVNITKITIHGYASPEGSYSNNARLARERTASMAKYVRNYYSFPNNVLTTKSTAEDWDGFRRMVDESDLSGKSDILNQIDKDDSNLDHKEWTIHQSVGPKTYRYILDNIYMALRHTDYEVTYNVRGFNNAETKEIIKKHPQELSLQEIYNLAKTYPEGSDDYNDCFNVAVVEFPDDPTANLNAAAMEIKKGGDLTQAKKYIAKADQNLAETQNNLGVIDLLEGRYDSAEQHFNKAKSMGLKVAETNLSELSSQRSFPLDDENQATPVQTKKSKKSKK